MAFKFFVIPVRDSAAAEAELNAFLRAHRALSVDRRWVDQGDNSFWSICVDFLPANATNTSTPAGGKGKIDYKAILSPEDFAVYAKLRELRKQIATDEAIPVYTIFTNEQLAQIVQTRARSRSALEKIDGVGEAKIDKYGHRFLELLGEQWKENHEASGPALGKDPGA